MLALTLVVFVACDTNKPPKPPTSIGQGYAYIFDCDGDTLAKSLNAFLTNNPKAKVNNVYPIEHTNSKPTKHLVMVEFTDVPTTLPVLER
jgi:hypothetical protein